MPRSLLKYVVQAWNEHRSLEESKSPVGRWPPFPFGGCLSPYSHSQVSAFSRMSPAHTFSQMSFPSLFCLSTIIALPDEKKNQFFFIWESLLLNAVYIHTHIFHMYVVLYNLIWDIPNAKLHNSHLPANGGREAWMFKEATLCPTIHHLPDEQDVTVQR